MRIVRTVGQAGALWVGCAGLVAILRIAARPCSLGKFGEKIKNFEYLDVLLEVVRMRWSETYGFLLAHAT